MLAAVILAFQLEGASYSVGMRTTRAQTCVIDGPNKKHWEFAPKRLKPWKLRVGQVDNDRRIELLVGVFKRTHIVKGPHRTLFIYDFDGKEVRPKWRASSLGRDLIDFMPADFGGPRVITIERGIDGIPVLAEWKWRGFGLYKICDLAHGEAVAFDSMPWPPKTVIAKVDGKALKWKR